MPVNQTNFQLIYRQNMSQIASPEIILYQNTQLLQQNKLLSEENTHLLDKISKQATKIKQLQSVEYVTLVNQRQQIGRLISAKIPQLNERFQHCQINDDRLTVNMQVLQAMPGQQKNLSAVSLLIESLEGCLQQLGCQHSESKSEKLRLIERKLNARQEQRKVKTQSHRQVTIHYVKDPTNSIKQLVSTARIQSQDLLYIRNFYESLVFQIVSQKNNGQLQYFASRTLEKLFELFSETVQLRWKVKQAEADLSLIQREYEMGNIGQCAINEAVSNLENACKQLRISRNSLSHDQAIIFLH